jgi:thiopeptide-type bacteriocin biosynthesis protein
VILILFPKVSQFGKHKNLQIITYHFCINKALVCLFSCKVTYLCSINAGIFPSVKNSSMQSWYSIHLTPKNDHNSFLVSNYLPFCEQYIWSMRGARAFFIRYEDHTGLHLRLRFKGDNEWLEKTLQPAIQQQFKKKGTWIAVPYNGETDRFGGAQNLAWAEEHFHISTRVVLARLSRPNHGYGDALFDGLKMLVMVGFAANLSKVDMAHYYDQLCDQWIKAFFLPSEGISERELSAAVREDFNATLAPQFSFLQDALSQVLIDLETMDSSPNPENNYDNKQPEWLRWLKGNQLIFKELGAQKEVVLPHVLHLSNNRLGVINQDEAYMLYVLASVLK